MTPPIQSASCPLPGFHLGIRLGIHCSQAHCPNAQANYTAAQYPPPWLRARGFRCGCLEYWRDTCRTEFRKVCSIPGRSPAALYVRRFVCQLSGPCIAPFRFMFVRGEAAHRQGRRHTAYYGPKLMFGFAPAEPDRLHGQGRRASHRVSDLGSRAAADQRHQCFEWCWHYICVMCSLPGTEHGSFSTRMFPRSNMGVLPQCPDVGHCMPQMLPPRTTRRLSRRTRGRRQSLSPWASLQPVRLTRSAVLKARRLAGRGVQIAFVSFTSGTGKC